MRERLRERRIPPHPFVAGAIALAWLLLRSGSKPSRLGYPCQQAAVSAAVLAFGAPLVAAAVALRRRMRTGELSPGLLLLAAAGLLAVLAFWTYAPDGATYAGPILSPPAEYRAGVFHETDCPQDPVGDRFPGLDDLIEMMGGHGLKFYKSDTASLVAGPDGLLAADDVVAIKINYQWAERGGTNTDVLRGLIHRVLHHPDGFTGEVVVVENAQFASTQGFDRAENNAQDTSQSPHDVVVHFQNLGYRISHFDWTPTRYTSVDEYSEGDMTDGYVVYAYDPGFSGRLSYPKFQTSHGTRISLKHGIWDETTGYDREHLKFINVPVLKSHGTYGATVAVKNYMGVVTRELFTNSHSSIRFGILGALQAEIGLADLTLIDSIWINARPSQGPGTPYENATRRDELVAGVDPIAADMWAVKNILIPAFEDNGFEPPFPKADPDDPTSDFRQYLDASMYYILNAGHDVTNDLSKIDEIATAPPGEASDPEGGGSAFAISKHPDGFELTWSAPVRGGAADEYNLYRTPLVMGAERAAPECEAYLGTGTSAVLPSLPDDHGFIVVGRNAVGDGSFGHDSLGNERPSPAGGSACP